MSLASASRSEKTIKASPVLIPLNVRGIPGELRALRRWVLWNLEERESRQTKVPYQARRGRLVGYRVGGRRLWRFRSWQVDEWLEGTHAPMKAPR